MSVPNASERVLSTLNQDGSRHWIHPKLSRGRFLRRRRIVGYALIALFVTLPFIRIGGRPAFLLDLQARELSVLGAVFRPSDAYVLMALGLSIVLGVFLVTALLGRIWCGWGCPQTVYLEHVFRPIERWLEGSPSERRKLDEAGRLAPRRVLKWCIYLVLCFALANVFLSYFVGVDRLEHWLLGNPARHPGGFALVSVVTALMVFDFAYFREQACIVACPYGRLQSVLLDRQSLIIGYDRQRGEPRGKVHKSLPVVSDAPAGDCVDCGACVATCPTGIDIRDGLQMECIGCAQCIDACDAVMAKLERAPGLVRYASQDELAGRGRKLVRVRTIVYPALLAVALGALVFGIRGHSGTEVWVQRISGPAFVELPDGKVSSQARVKLENQSDRPAQYQLMLVGAPDAALRIAQPRWDVPARRAVEIPLFVDLPRTAFVDGERKVDLTIIDDAGFHRVVTLTLLGPAEVTP